jgi:hypothetical protein
MRLANLGKKHAPEALKKCSEASLKNWSDPAYREKVLLARTGKKRGQYKRKRSEMVN